MSKYLAHETAFTSVEMLRDALIASGIPFEEHVDEAALFTYLAEDKQGETGRFIIRRQHLTHLSNDYGLHWDEESKSFVEIVSDWDVRQNAVTQIRNRIWREYAFAAEAANAQMQGYQVSRQDGPNGEILVAIDGWMDGQGFTLSSTISSDGRTVDSHITGMQGPSCQNVAQLLNQIGRQTRDDPSDDFYKPQPLTGANVAGAGWNW